jgi:hypothetical protein
MRHVHRVLRVEGVEVSLTGTRGLADGRASLGVELYAP